MMRRHIGGPSLKVVVAVTGTTVRSPLVMGSSPFGVSTQTAGSLLAAAGPSPFLFSMRHMGSTGGSRQHDERYSQDDGTPLPPPPRSEGTPFSVYAVRLVAFLTLGLFTVNLVLYTMSTYFPSLYTKLFVYQLGGVKEWSAVRDLRIALEDNRQIVLLVAKKEEKSKTSQEADDAAIPEQVKLAKKMEEKSVILLFESSKKHGSKGITLNMAGRGSAAEFPQLAGDHSIFKATTTTANSLGNNMIMWGGEMMVHSSSSLKRKEESTPKDSPSNDPHHHAPAKSATATNDPKHPHHGRSTGSEPMFQILHRSQIAPSAQDRSSRTSSTTNPEQQRYGSDMEVLPGLFIGADLTELESHLKWRKIADPEGGAHVDPRNDVLLFLGLKTWYPQELEYEMATGKWEMIAITPARGLKERISHYDLIFRSSKKFTDNLAQEQRLQETATSEEKTQLNQSSSLRVDNFGKTWGVDAELHQWLTKCIEDKILMRSSTAAGVGEGDECPKFSRLT